MLFEKLRKEKKFQQYRYRNSNKKYERRKVNNVMGGGRKNLNFGNEITEILATRNSCLGEMLGEVPEREKPIMATKLPKL